MFNFGNSHSFNPCLNGYSPHSLNLLMNSNAASLANAAARPRFSMSEPDSKENIDNNDTNNIEDDKGNITNKDGGDDANNENEDNDKNTKNKEGKEDSPEKRDEELLSRVIPLISGMFSCTGPFGEATIAISPGRLGLSLKMIEGCVTVTKVDPASLLRGQVQVGDVIFTVDGTVATSVEDVKRGHDRVRKLGIIKRGNDSANAAAASRAEGGGEGTDRRKSKRPRRAVPSASGGPPGGPIAAPAEWRFAPGGFTTVPAEWRFVHPMDYAQTRIMYQRQQDIAAREYENIRAPPSKFPNLEELGATGDDVGAVRTREALLAELFGYDFDIVPKMLLKRYDHHNRGKVKVRGEEGKFQEYQVMCIPTSRKKDVESQTTSKEQLNNIYFHNEGRSIFDRIISAWASFCDGDNADAAKMILFYMASKFPSSYVNNVKSTTEEDVLEMSTKKQVRAPRPDGKRRRGPPPGYEPLKLPLDYVSYDGTSDVHWNTKYGELIRYKEQFGDCRVYLRSVLGKWVSQMRSNKRLGAKNLTPKRIQLLDDIGFLWCGVREGEPKRNPRGQTRHHRAVAAKITFPQLTIRECLYLGGYEDEELNVIPNPKHSWRTAYVALKDTIKQKIRKYDAALATRNEGNKKSWTEIFKFTALLQGGDDGRFQKVFGDCSDLLPQFLEAADERASRGIFEKELRSANRTGSDTADGEERRPAEEQADIEVTDEPLEPPDTGTGSDNEDQQPSPTQK